ncbi:hypothetical protein C8Q78DRAFT_988988 [Trametes maxima]|nr:hypothetical protein C8Q78DRAFT_988988 [Trametes maxima]
MNGLRLYRILTSVAAFALSIFAIVQLVRLLNDIRDMVGQSSPGFTAPPYVSLGIAVGAITVCTSVVMIVLDFFAVNALMSAIAFEIGWTVTLVVLWLAVAITTLNVRGPTGRGNALCSEVRETMKLGEFGDIVHQAQVFCDTTQLIPPTSFAVFGLLFLYTQVLLLVDFLRYRGRSGMVQVTHWVGIPDKTQTSNSRSALI